MIFPRLRLDASVLAIVSVVAQAQGQTTASAPNLPDAQKAFVTRYCVGCHNEKVKTGGISLHGIDFSNVSKEGDTWEKVLRKVHTGQMPPQGLPRSAAPAATAFTGWLQKSLDDAAARNPNPGRPAVHRLNRAEYSNAIRDLLALDINPGATLPVDDSGYGFDNIADVLSMSPVLLEQYLSTARRVSRLAVGDLKMKPVEERFEPPREVVRAGGTRGGRVSDDLPFGSRGGLAVEYYFPLDGEYVFRLQTNGNPDTGELPPPVEVRLPVKAGLHRIGISFPRESARPELSAPPNARRSGAPAGPPPQFTAEMDLRLDGARAKQLTVSRPGGLPDISRLTVGGPYQVTGRGETPSRARIFVCRPASARNEHPCAEKILSTLARRAFRRPVTSADLKPLLAFFNDGRREGDFDAGIQKALMAMLVSPDFLFRVEQDPPGSAPGAVYALNDYELASRLSFFLWSSIPDDQLLDIADQGKLKDSAVLAQQVRRMLDDPRAQALVDNLGGQWLYLRNLATAKPDPEEFADFDDPLRRALEQETKLFFASVIREDRSILTLLDANYTYLNQRLAEHYGIPRIYGSQFRRVTLSDPNRGGLLGQGSILTVTSYPNRTSVVQRGKWVLENLLGAPPPPPPPDIPDLTPHGKDGQQLTMRQAMEQHRANPTCASCHSRMDPIGFALENYDGIGKWRTRDAGADIDASGTLPGGAQFNGPAGLKKILLAAHKDEFVETAIDRIMTYALGRGVESHDRPAIRAMMRDAERNDYRVSALIAAIVQSKQFRMRRTPEQ